MIGKFLEVLNSNRLCLDFYMSEQIFSWMMDGFIRWPKPYLLLSATSDETLSWIIEIYG